MKIKLFAMATVVLFPVFVISVIPILFLSSGIREKLLDWYF